MWEICFLLSVLSVPLFGIVTKLIHHIRKDRRKSPRLFRMLFAGMYVASFFLIWPLHESGFQSAPIPRLVLTIFSSSAPFGMGLGFSDIQEALTLCPDGMQGLYQAWVTILMLTAPIFTLGFVLTFFRNLSASLKYLTLYLRDTYIFSDLTDGSLALARDIRKNHPKAGLVFNNVQDKIQDSYNPLKDEAEQLGAVYFRKDITTAGYRLHHHTKALYFFTISADENRNLNLALNLIEAYKTRQNTHLYLFSSKTESELTLSSLEKGCVRVRRINQVRSLINQLLYDEGHRIFQHTKEQKGLRDISAVIVGLGRRGTEMLKALTWFCQMDGYRLHISCFDRDPLAREKFTALAPELMSPEYNGVFVQGEAAYTIQIHGDCPVETAAFAKQIQALNNATYVFVALGDDETNVDAAVRLRMLFERNGCHPIIQAVMENTRQKKALSGIRNFRGQPYDIELIGDMEACYAENVIMASQLESTALAQHMKWDGSKEEDFWNFEYNYRSSIASIIHMNARIQCGIPGADKLEKDLTLQERDIIETLEHRRWNAYMRAEGYVFSGSTDAASRNDLGKMHHDLVVFSLLTEEEKRKDSRVGTK